MFEIKSFKELISYEEIEFINTNDPRPEPVLDVLKFNPEADSSKILAFDCEMVGIPIFVFLFFSLDCDSF